MALRRFAEGVYLHQVVIRAGDRLQRFLDLPQALAEPRRGDEWRVHFHVPLFREQLGFPWTRSAWSARSTAIVIAPAWTRKGDGKLWRTLFA